MARNTELMPLEPEAMMHRMFREFNSMFEHRGGFPFVRPFRPEFAGFPWSPELELSERDSHLVLTLDLPGLKKEDISVQVDKDELTISGERTHESEAKKNDWFRTERSYGSFCRIIPLPGHVKATDITARFTGGVLEVTMPLPAKAEATATKVPIGEGESEKKAVKVAA